MSDIDKYLNQIIQGDCLEVMRGMPDNSIHCTVTSPPYWGLRDYGIDGQFGMEATLEEYVTRMVEVFREVRRILRDDGTLWLNLGDSYATQRNGRSAQETKAIGNDDRAFRDKPFSTVGNGLKSKDLCGIPWRTALALQSDGWYLRSDVIWAKPNPMPESVRDRPTKAHEYLFLLAKSGRYFYDQEAVREVAIDYGSAEAYKSRIGKKRYHEGNSDPAGGGFRGNGGFQTSPLPTNGRNRRTIWTIATQPFPEAHFATFPEKLIEPCILASTSEYGCCAECGGPYERVIELGEVYSTGGSKNGARASNLKIVSPKGQTPDNAFNTGQFKAHRHITTGWQPTCRCNSNKITPAIVLDPFFGSGTTGLVARKLRRNYVGIELSPDYVEIAKRRVSEFDGVQLELPTGEVVNAQT